MTSDKFLVLNSILPTRKTEENSTVGKKVKWRVTKIFEPILTTKEHYRLSRLLAIRDYLDDKTVSIENSKNLKLKRGTQRRKLCVDKILRSMPGATIELGSDSYVRTTRYGFLKEHSIGRIYSGDGSIPYYPRDIRYLLFSDLYLDFDLENAHPTIAYEFALEKGMTHLPCLEALVKNRAGFMQLVKKYTSNRDPKKLVLMAFGAAPEKFKPVAEPLVRLGKEMIMVRSLMKIDLQERHPDWDIEGLELTTLQSHFCSSKESEMLLSLREYLLSEIPRDNDPLHFIPLYDGAYVRHENESIHRSLPEFVEEFNKSETLLQFRLKPIEHPNEEYSIPLATILKYETMQIFLHKLSSTEFELLLDKLEIPPFELPKDLVNDLKTDWSEREMSLNMLWNEKIQLKRVLDKGNPYLVINQEKIDKITPLGFLEKHHRDKIELLTSSFNSHVRNALLKHGKCTLKELEGLVTKDSDQS